MSITELERQALRQIIKNFLANAAKFTQKGGVKVSIARAADAARPVSLSVEDTGIGIPEDKQEIIFEAFQQADGCTRRRYGGTGLGLSICRELAGLLGGSIRVDSREGRGSRFSLLLPLELRSGSLDPARIVQERLPASSVSGRPGPASAAAKTFSGRGVLLVERDVSSLVGETRLLESFGLGVQTAADADAA